MSASNGGSPPCEDRPEKGTSRREGVSPTGGREYAVDENGHPLPTDGPIEVPGGSSPIGEGPWPQDGVRNRVELALPKKPIKRMPGVRSRRVRWLSDLLRLAPKLVEADRSGDDDYNESDERHFDPSALPHVEKFCREMTKAASWVSGKPSLIQACEKACRGRLDEFLLKVRDFVREGKPHILNFGDTLGDVCRALELLDCRDADLGPVALTRRDRVSGKVAPAGEQAADAPPSQGAVDFPNPSAPVSLQKAADAWGGQMTRHKLRKAMDRGRVRYQEKNRQTFVFCRDDVPNLPPAQKNSPN